MRSRPLTYKDTPQLDLDSFILYCSNAQMKVNTLVVCMGVIYHLSLIPLQAKLFSIPITPGIVVGGFFVIGFVFYLVFNLSEKTFSWANWL